MPQLIAMVIVVVGAIIYMFQTFGGTGDKIEGIAQKTSAITEINNIKNGLKLAARAEHIEISTGTGVENAKSLEGLAELSYFQEQINDQLDADGTTDTDNVYQAISFGADASMEIRLVNDKAGMVPGIFVRFAGTLTDNAGFLEAQIANDLANIATIDRTAVLPDAFTDATVPPSGALTAAQITAGQRVPANVTDPATSALLGDGMFTIYFNDFGANEVVVP